MSKHILVVGGGIGGTMTANSLVSKLYPEISNGKIKVSMLPDSPWHYYKPAFMYVAFDMMFKDRLRRKQSSLLRPATDSRADAVNAADCKAPPVTTASTS